MALQLSFYQPSHARFAQWPTLKSEQTSVWLGLLKIDKSLTSVSGAQAAYVGSTLDIWQADRSFSPPTATSENMPPRHQTVSKSGSCLQRDTEGSCRYSMICAVCHSPRWFAGSVLQIKKKSALPISSMSRISQKNNNRGLYCWAALSTYTAQDKNTR